MKVKFFGKPLKWRFFVLLLLLLSLLVWTVRQLSWVEIANLLTAFNFQEIFILSVINLLILGLFTYRWAIIQTRVDRKIPFQKLFIYRLIGFGISYFTPGPQIGGEPAQVFLLRNNHKTSSEKAISSVVLDRLIDAIVNFVILAFGLFVLINSNLFVAIAGSIYLYAFIGFLLIPIFYFVLLLNSILPLTKLLNKMRLKIVNIKLIKVSETLINAEFQISEFIRSYPLTFLKVTLVSIISWGLMVYEYWLMLYFMDVTINGLSLVSIMTTARLAFLTPIPAGLGALEASQYLVMQLLGLSPLIGISAALYIRIRDSIIGLSGLLLASVFLPKRKVIKEVII